MEREKCQVYGLPRVWRLVKVGQMSIYNLDDDPEKILVEGYKPTSGKRRIKKGFLCEKYWYV